MIENSSYVIPPHRHTYPKIKHSFLSTLETINIYIIKYTIYYIYNIIEYPFQNILNSSVGILGISLSEGDYTQEEKNGLNS